LKNNEENKYQRMKMMKKLLVMTMNEVVGVCEVDFLDLR